MAGLYAADGSLNVTVVSGTSYTGLYAANGSYNVIKSPGTSLVGAYHPCGAMWVSISPGTLSPMRAPDGSLYVQRSPYKENAGQKVTVVSGSLFFEAESEALFAAMTTPPTDARKAKIDALIVALKNAGVWTKLDVLYVLAAADSQAARLNWKLPGTYTCTVNGSMLFDIDLGYTSQAGTGWLDTGWNVSTNGVTFLQDSAHLGVVCNTAVSDTNFDAGTGGNLRIGAKSGTTITGRINSADTHTAPTVSTSVGHTVIIRTLGFQTGAKDGVLDTPVAIVSPSAPANATLRICGNISTTFSARRITACHAGGELTGANVLALYNALAAYP